MAAVAFAWESQSISRVGCSAAARQAARFTAVVVFPTPPFWLAIAITRAKAVPQTGESNRASPRKQDVSRGTVEIARRTASSVRNSSFHVERCELRDKLARWHPL